MPYIDVESRQQLIKRRPLTVGELTYRLYKECRSYLNKNKQYKYQDLAEVLGALEATKLEFYAKIVRPYEEIKLKENGDVF
mgnify:FL=1